MMRRAVVITAVLLGPAVPALCQPNAQSGEVALPATPSAVRGVLAVRPFTLATPYEYTWSSTPRRVASGSLVVLDVDPRYVAPRNGPEPVLFAGNVAIQRLNQGDKSGRVLGIVPGDVDLSTAVIWFGTPQLPERLTPAIIESERGLAQRAGIRAPGQARVAAAARARVAAPDLATLLRTTGADLLLQYSPQEKALADAWRLPTARATTRPR